MIAGSPPSSVVSADETHTLKPVLDQDRLMTIGIRDTIAKCDDQMEADIGAETLMMRMDSGRYYSVDGPAQSIWAAIDGPTRVESIVELLLERYDVDRETCETQTLALLDDLLAQQLITRLNDTQM